MRTEDLVRGMNLQWRGLLVGRVRPALASHTSPLSTSGRVESRLERQLTRHWAADLTSDIMKWSVESLRWCQAGLAVSVVLLTRLIASLTLPWYSLKSIWKSSKMVMVGREVMESKS